METGEAFTGALADAATEKKSLTVLPIATSVENPFFLTRCELGITRTVEKEVTSEWPTGALSVSFLYQKHV